MLIFRLNSNSQILLPRYSLNYCITVFFHNAKEKEEKAKKSDVLKQCKDVYFRYLPTSMRQENIFDV